jgi:hypothetical protein
MANAHAWRHRKGYGHPCPTGCIYCKDRPNKGLYTNKNGHRRNPGQKKKGRRNPAANVQK